MRASDFFGDAGGFPLILPGAIAEIRALLKPEHVRLLSRIADEESLFQYGFPQDRTYDFGPSQPIDRALVDTLIALDLVSFYTPPIGGLAIPAKLTELGKVVLKLK